MPPKDTCVDCGRPCVGRLCYRCIGIALSQPTPAEQPKARETNVTYPEPKRKK
jgi:hypothetical protein